MADEGSKAGDTKQSPAGGTIQVSSRQRGNPILKSIRSVPWEFAEGLAPDYILGTCFKHEASNVTPYNKIRLLGLIQEKMISRDCKSKSFRLARPKCFGFATQNILDITYVEQ